MRELTVLSWNLHWGRRSERGPRRERQQRFEPFDVVDRLLAYDADVCVLPEHFRYHDGGGIADGLRAEGYELVELPFVRLAFDPASRVTTPGEGWWGLVLATRLPLIDHELIPMAHVIHDRAGARAAIRAGIEVDGMRVDVVGLHTSSKLWWAGPVVQLRGLRSTLDALASGPCVVAGDFNLWGPPVEALLRGWKRTVVGRTWPAYRPHSQIDHILVNDHLATVSSSVMESTPSDHRAVRARLSVRAS